MAHHWRKGPGPVAAGCAAVLALAVCDARALTLGEARVRSSLGDPLDVRVPVTLASGESIEPGCFTLVREGGGDVPRVTGARISVERSASGTQLRIETRAPVNEPAFVMGIAASCGGQASEVKRDYSLLLDPPPVGRAPPSQAPAPATARAQPPATTLTDIAATLMARIGDTLESIAHAIFPKNSGARRTYIEALRDANPSLATLRDSDPIPVDTPVALPDLRTFAKGRSSHLARQEPAGEPIPRRSSSRRSAPAEAAEPSARAEMPAPPKSAPPAKASEVPGRATATPRVAEAPRRADPAPKAAAPARASPGAPPSVSRGDAFVLRLSSSEVDLTRSRSIDDRKRAQLRERQMILDQDDQVAAVLALRHSVKQLESQVAELRLKLAGMPTSFPAPAAKAEPPKVEAPPPAPPKVEPPKVAEAPKLIPPKVEAPKPEPPKVEAPKVEPPKAEPPKAEAPKVAPAKVEAAKVEAPKAEAKPAAKAAEPNAEPVVVKRTVTDEEWLRYGLWVLAVLLLFAAAYLAWRLWRRRRAEAAEEEGDVLEVEPGAAPADDMIVVADENVTPDLELEPEAKPAGPEYTADGRRIIDADVELPTRVGTDTDDLRRRYIEERFPEITKGAILLDDPDSVVKGARLFYEDGAIARAVELLQFAIERRPSDIKVWLALFEIFRLERLTGEFAALAQRFKEAHGSSPYWPKVQYFGREIDPGNSLYHPPPINNFETIGPAQAKRIAAESTFDPIAENWLGAPMDFENEVLANDLRKAVMADAGISDGDLLPNPMPALRNVEMFTVA